MKNVTKMWTLIFLLAATQSYYGQAKKTSSMQQNQQTTIEIKPSITSSEKDFDFLEGKWKVHNRMLKERLNNTNEWSEFESELHLRKTINGLGNVENYYATFNNSPFEGMAVRLYNPKTRLWKVYWMDSNNGTMDENPVTGSFDNGIGKFYTNDVFNGIPILVLYQWDATNAQHPKWSQAFSADNGKTWEWNWEMTLSKME